MLWNPLIIPYILYTSSSKCVQKNTQILSFLYCALQRFAFTTGIIRLLLVWCLERRENGSTHLSTHSSLEFSTSDLRTHGMGWISPLHLDWSHAVVASERCRAWGLKSCSTASVMPDDACSKGETLQCTIKKRKDLSVFLYTLGARSI